MRGRKPQPTALKLLRGNPGRRPLNRSEPVPRAGAMTCPRHLDAVARREWKRVVKAAPPALLTPLDAAVLAMYCDAYSRAVVAREHLPDSATWVNCTARGYEQPSPWLGILGRAETMLLKAAGELGFTPSARSRVHLSDAAAGASLEELLTGIPAPADDTA